MHSRDGLETTYMGPDTWLIQLMGQVRLEHL
jgi:hypothetical protein